MFVMIHSFVYNIKNIIDFLMFNKGLRPRSDTGPLRLFAVVLGVVSGVYIFKDSFESGKKLQTTEGKEPAPTKSTASRG